MKDSTMKAIKAYLMIRKAVFFMARPLFYVISITVILALIAIPGSKSAISIATVKTISLIPEFVNWLIIGPPRQDSCRVS